MVMASMKVWLVGRDHVEELSKVRTYLTSQAGQTETRRI